MDCGALVRDFYASGESFRGNSEAVYGWSPDGSRRKKVQNSRAGVQIEAFATINLSIREPEIIRLSV